MENFSPLDETVVLSATDSPVQNKSLNASSASPFRDITNASINKTPVKGKSPRKQSASRTPSKVEDARWRERTEVVTSLETQNHQNSTSASVESFQQRGNIPVAKAADSDSEYESASETESPTMDRTVSIRSPSNFISPSKSSTASNTPTVGIREENLFNDSLISSFEKLGMSGLNETATLNTQEQTEEERAISPENFQDAAQDIVQKNVQDLVFEDTAQDIVQQISTPDIVQDNATQGSAQVIMPQAADSEMDQRTIPLVFEPKPTATKDVAPLVNKNLLPTKKVDLNDSLTSMFEKMCSIPSANTELDESLTIDMNKSPLNVPNRNLIKSPFSVNTPSNKLFKIDLKKVDDPSYDPLQPPVVNSPVLDSANTTLENKAAASPIPPKKDYAINFEKINDPTFDPFETKELIVNTPTLESEEEAIAIGKQLVEDGNANGNTDEQQTQTSVYSSEESVIAEAQEKVVVVPDEALKMHHSVQEQVPDASDSNVCIKSDEDTKDVGNVVETENCQSVDSSEPSVVSENQKQSPVKENTVLDSSSVDAGNLTPLKKMIPHVEPSPCRKSEKSIINVQTPTRKNQHKVDWPSEDGEEISTPLGGRAQITPTENSIASPVKEDNVVESELDDEPLPPKKSYDLEFLDKLDDPNYDPFSTKTSVMNSPTKDKVKNTPSKTPAMKAVPTPVKAVPTPVKAVPTPVKAVPSPVKAVPTPVKAEPTSVKTEAILVKEDSTPVKMTETPIKEPTPVKMVETLIKETTPVKKAASPIKTDQTPIKAIPTPVKMEATAGNEHINLVTQKANEDEISDFVEEEPVPPKKAYNLEFLDNLDDPNFDPFSTKASITNSPGKGGIKNTPVKKVLTEKSEPTPVKKSEPTPVKKSEPTPVKKSEPTPIKKSEPTPIKKSEPTPIKKSESYDKSSSSQKSEIDAADEEELLPPKKAYDLGFLDNLDDPNFNPFDTKTAVTNSPGKDGKNSGGIKTTPVKAASTNVPIHPAKTPSKNAEPIPSKSEIENTPEKKPLPTKPKTPASVKKVGGRRYNSKRTPKKSCPSPLKTEEMNQPTDSNTDSQNIEIEEELKLPKGAYNLDFDNLDDANFNPFSTKASVNNSPGKSKGMQNTPVKESTKKAEPTPKKAEPTPKKAEPTPKKAEPTPKKAEPTPKKAEPTPKKAELTPKEAELSPGKKSSPVKSVAGIEEDNIEDEPLPPKKAYNLDFLENLDDPNFDPFSTKVAVLNTPEKGKPNLSEGVKNTPDKPVSKKSLLDTAKQTSVKEPSPAKKAEPTPKKAELTPKKAELTPKKAEPTPKKAELIQLKKTTPLKKDQVEENLNASIEDEPLPPKKAYDLDFLDNLDDPNFNPFSTKAAVVNTPEKGKPNPSVGVQNTPEKPVSKKSLLVDTAKQTSVEEAPPVKAEPASKKAEPMPKKSVPKHVKELNSSPLKKIEKTEENENDTEDEPLPPKKGYDLDFLNNLDDPSLNPFATKAAVVNTPEKGNSSSGGIKNSPEKPTAKKCLVVDNSSGCNKSSADSSSASSNDTESPANNEILPEKKTQTKPWKKSALKKKAPINKEPQTDVENLEKANINGEILDDEPVPPKKGYDLDFLNNLDDPNLNPFSTKSAVTNSPGKNVVAGIKNSPLKIETKTSDNNTKENIPDNKENKTKQPKQPLKKPTQKPAPATEQETEKQDEPIPTKKAYSMDFLDNLDDPNFNPFNTKSAVDNSPSKGKKDSCGLKNTPIKAEPQITSETGKTKPSKRVQTPKKSEEIKKEDAEPVAIKKGYNPEFLDNLDDPNFNPFQTKVAVGNSPAKNKNKSVSRENAKGTMSEYDSFDCNFNPFTDKSKVGNSPNSNDFKPPRNVATPKKACNLDTSAAEDFDRSFQDGVKLFQELTPHNKAVKSKTPAKTPVANVQSQNYPPSIFSPVPQSSTAAPTTQGTSDNLLSLENFTSGTVFFDNAEDLDELGSHGNSGDKINLVRNSLYVKFDPLVAGRKSLAHFLAKPEEETEEDLRRGSGLMHFSPSPTKKQKMESAAATPTQPGIRTIANETLEVSGIDDTVLLDASKNDISLRDVTILEKKVCEELPAAAAVTANEDMKEVLQQQEVVFQERLREQEQRYQERLKALLMEQAAQAQEKIKQQELIAQDSFLRHCRETEEVQKKLKQELMEHGIVISQTEDENEKLKKTVKDLQTVFKKLMSAKGAMEKEHTEKISLMETKYNAISASQRQEIQQWQDDLKKTEDGFFDIAKRYERLRDATKTIHHNEQMLKTQNDDLRAELSQKKDAFKEAIATLEEKYAKIQQDGENEKAQKDQEIKKAQVMLRRAEVKILSLNDTISKKDEELQRQGALLDEITKGY